uniref:Putative secreted protein n=1 Tax=Anopheles darlingi TaxID=43151 RepID=A0A2M4D8J0_ANODA
MMMKMMATRRRVGFLICFSQSARTAPVKVLRNVYEAFLTKVSEGPMRLLYAIERGIESEGTDTGASQNGAYNRT